MLNSQDVDLTSLIYKLGSVGLRGLTMVGRFALLIALATLLPPTDVGIYGLVVVTVAYGVMVLGLDFYTFSTRELLARKRTDWPPLLKGQFTLHMCVYAVGLPAFAVLLAPRLFPLPLVWWVVALLVTEHLARELNRLLIAAGKPFRANALLFLQKGLWSLAVPLVMLSFSVSRRIEIVLGAWLISALMTIWLSIWSLRELGCLTQEAVDWSWIAKGLRVASLFFIGTLLLQAITTVDRYFLEAIGGLDSVGVYTLFAGIAFAILAFLDAGVFAFIYPSVVTAYQTRSVEQFRSKMRQLRVSTIIGVVAISTILALIIRPALRIIDRPLYEAHLSTFWLLLAAVALNALAMIPHFGLYAMRRDRLIVVSNGLGFVAFFAFTAVGPSVDPITTVALGVLVGFAVLGLAKSLSYMVVRPGRSGIDAS